LAVETAKNELPVDRSVDRPTVIFWPLAATGRPIGRPSHIQRATLPRRSTARSTVRKQRATCSQSVDRLMGQPACTYPCTSVDRLLGTVDRPVDRPSLAAAVLVRKTCNLLSNKFS